MFQSTVIAFITLAAVLFAAAADNDWYRTASFYQIYPQTFYDGGGGSREGFGTFKGIQAKIPYFKELGVDCLWLTPIFESSFNAFGYDITNYEEIDSRYGTKADFESLVKAVHENGLKIIVDFVPNHCGYEHPFFQKSLAKDPVYDNWFVWLPGKGPNKDQPPSNWQRIGGDLGSAWNRRLDDKPIENRTEFFYAQFYWSMPDFNLREPAVKQYWEKFLNMWLEFGLDGFRVDAISHGFEVEPVDGQVPDEAINVGVEREDDFSYLHHNLTQDLPELFELIYDWRDILDKFEDSARIFMTESYSAPETIMKFYRNADNSRKGAHLPFNFQFIRIIRPNSTAEDFVDTVNDWFELLPDGEVTNWAIGNHDQSRVASRFGKQRVDIFNMLCTLLPGTSVTYYGEEIGMEDSCVNYNIDRNEPGSRCSGGATSNSDARYRTPMQWSNVTNGGFTNSSRPWLPIGDKYATVNVEAQRGVPGSHLEIYKSLLKIRKHKAVAESTLAGFKIVKLGSYSFGFKRELSDAAEQSVLVLINYGESAETVTLKELALVGEPALMTLEIVSGNSRFEIGQQLSVGDELKLEPFEALIAVYNSSRKVGAIGMAVLVVLCAALKVLV